MPQKSSKPIMIIVGAAGRIGKAAVKRFHQEYQVIAFDRSSAVFYSDDEAIIPLDVSNKESMISTFNHIKTNWGNKIAVVLHFAAYYTFNDNHSFKKYEKITIEGTRELLRLLQNFEVEQFIFSSTMLVHKATQPGVKIKEEDPLYPYWDYPKSKIITEALIQKECGSIKQVTIIRMAGVYDDECHSIPISTQLQRIYENQLLCRFYPGNRHHGSPYIHMQDLINMIALSIQKQKTLPPFLILLAAEDQTIPYIELHRRMSQGIFKRPFTLFWVPRALAKLGALFLRNSFIKPFMIDIADLHYELDMSKAKKLLGWSCKHSLDKELNRFIEAIKHDTRKFYQSNQLLVPRKLAKAWEKDDRKTPKSS